MQKSCGSKTLVHALSLTGLGGTGKTQLVLRYIEQHKKHYDTILWLDVRDEITTLFSSKRCCGALSIALPDRLTEGLLHDTPAVQKPLRRLSAREQGQKWLVVLDNADELDKLPQIIPQNAQAGSVIITSQDGKAAELLQRAKSTKVDKVEIDEGKALLAKAIKRDLAKASLDLKFRLEKLVFRLHGIALALDLAGARIRDDMDNSPSVDGSDAEGDVVDAIEQYLVDLEDHGKSSLSDPEHNAAKMCKKTIWTVWETVLSSLKRSEQRDPGSSGCTMHLLDLAVILGSTIVHDEIFKAASQYLVPTPQTECYLCRDILVTACCRTWNMCNDGTDFRCALRNYMTPSSRPYDNSDTQNGCAAMCTTLGTSLLSIHEICAAGRCLERAYELKSTLFGETASETMDPEVDLWRFYLLRVLAERDPAERNVGMEKANKVLGRILENPEGEIKIAAASWNFTMLSMQLSEWYAQCLEQCSGKSSAFGKMAPQKKYDELSKTVIPRQIQAPKLGVQRFGQHNRVVNTLRLNLVHINGFFLKFDLSKKHLEDLVASEQLNFDKFDERRMQTMEMLAICRLRTGNSETSHRVDA
ncbi:hypothetical protein Q7P35_009792 [Cladosporium inversicolor]